MSGFHETEVKTNLNIVTMLELINLFLVGVQAKISVTTEIDRVNEWRLAESRSLPVGEVVCKQEKVEWSIW